MKKSISILSILGAGLFAIVLGAVFSIAAGLPFEATAGVLFGLSFIPTGASGVLGMAIQREIWVNHIVENLYRKNPHLNFAFSADEFVLAGKTVHIPNAGTVASATRNRSSLPATVVTRTDQDVNFSLDEFTTPPVLVKNADEAELSYDKRQSVIGQHSDSLAQSVGDWMFYNWAPTTSAQMVRTTGADTAAHVDSATGNRKAMTIADLKSAQKLMNKNSVPQADRYCTLDADMYDQLLGDLTTTQYKDFSAFQDVENGVIGKLYGFKILDPRGEVLRYDNAATPVPKEPGAAGAAADNGAALCWHKDAVIKAVGQNEVFENENDATYYGDILSGLIRAGGRKRRYDAKGVVAIVQAASA